MIFLHAIELTSNKKGFIFLTQDKDVMVLALRRYLLLGPNTALVMGTGDKRRKIMLKPIF